MPSPANNEDKSRSRQGRIPATLQAVFLASNRGKNVDKPPPAKVASKVFIRNWLFQRQTATKENDKSLLDGLGSRRLERGHTKSVIASTPKKKKKVAVPTRRPGCELFLAWPSILEPSYRDTHYTNRTTSSHYTSGCVSHRIAPGVSRCHDSFPRILDTSLQESAEHVLQQTLAVANRELPHALDRGCQEF